MQEQEQLDKLFNELTEIKIQLAINNENLREHMRRTELLENLYDKLVEANKPIQKHIGHVEGALKLIIGSAVVIGIFVSILQIIKFFV